MCAFYSLPRSWNAKCAYIISAKSALVSVPISFARTSRKDSSYDKITTSFQVRLVIMRLVMMYRDCK